jgi:hypothetical protein
MRTILLSLSIILLFNGCIFSKKRSKKRTTTEHITRNLDINQQALIVGVGNYKDSAYDLLGIELDIQRMNKLFSSWGFEVKTVRNAESMDFQKLLTDYANNLGEDDVFILYFSGHGSSTVDKSGDELDDDRDELIVVSNGEKNLFILDDNLDKYLEKIRARKLIIIDACNSGTINRNSNSDKNIQVKYIPAPANVGDSKEDITIPIQSFMPVQTGPYIFFAACRDNERSFTSKDGSTFTNTLLSFIDIDKSSDTIHKKVYNSLSSNFHPKLSSSDESLKFNTLRSYLKIIR